ncbi:hypothetical protein K7X08_017700 [Anisodus acutangulus]|uniref:PDZ domain-containing protein n=1 Tax=Anisodus acutangulus TaxID=402998 RepID=A0A9Q1R8U5_9SOLA|nr:hypothetical protein K7X08_017700 [Anisodus acutangulus]
MEQLWLVVVITGCSNPTAATGRKTERDEVEALVVNWLCNGGVRRAPAWEIVYTYFGGIGQWPNHRKSCQASTSTLARDGSNNLYAARLYTLEQIISKFPDVLEGVIVEELVPGSSAESAGLKHNDVIIQFGGKRIQSFLELLENMWNNVGESVELAVIRASHDVPLYLSMVVEEATSDKLYSWPLWEV